MNKKNRNRIFSFIVLLFFIGSQGLFLYHSHTENDTENTCEHSGSDNHIHNKHTDKCEICQHNFNSPISYFKVKSLHFYGNDFQEYYFKNNRIAHLAKSIIHLRGPPFLNT